LCGLFLHRISCISRNGTDSRRGNAPSRDLPKLDKRVHNARDGIAQTIIRVWISFPAALARYNVSLIQSYSTMVRTPRFLANVPPARKAYPAYARYQRAFLRSSRPCHV
jgi:hypothetical protein